MAATEGAARADGEEDVEVEVKAKKYFNLSDAKGKDALVAALAAVGVATIARGVLLPSLRT